MPSKADMKYMSGVDSMAAPFSKGGGYGGGAKMKKGYGGKTGGAMTGGEKKRLSGVEKITGSRKSGGGY